MIEKALLPTYPGLLLETLNRWPVRLAVLHLPDEGPATVALLLDRVVDRRRGDIRIGRHLALDPHPFKAYLDADTTDYGVQLFKVVGTLPASDRHVLRRLASGSVAGGDRMAPAMSNQEAEVRKLFRRTFATACRNAYTWSLRQRLAGVPYTGLTLGATAGLSLGRLERAARLGLESLEEVEALA